MALFKFFWDGDVYLGVDIGTTSIKVAEIKRQKNNHFILQNYGILETYGYLKNFNNALQTSSLKLLETEAAKYLRELISRSRIKADKVIASLPAFAAFTTLIELPPMSDAEVAQVIKYQAKQYIPLPLSAVTVDWLRVGEREIFLIAMLNEQIEKYQTLFKLAGLKLVGLEIEGLSLARALTLGLKEPVLIIDIGARSSSLSIAENGLLKFISQTDFAGGSLTQSLAVSLNISPMRAEELKKESGLTGAGGTQELSTLMRPLLDVIINEARRVKNNYESAYKQAVRLVILAGGGSRLAGLAEYMQSQLGVQVVKGNPFERVKHRPELLPLLEDLKVSLATAIGAGMKNVQQS